MPLETIVRRITTWTVVWLGAAAVAALCNWYAVERGARLLEYVAKPATTTTLIVAALALDPAHGAARAWTVGALMLCLAGDVFLMLPSDQFVPGLASFLVGHVVFIAAFAAAYESGGPLWLLTLIGAVAAQLLVTPRVVRGASKEDPKLGAAVLVYAAVISAMLVFSAVTRDWVAVAGAAMFVVSDSILATNRFVNPMRHGRLATMVTYHAALALLVVSLA